MNKIEQNLLTILGCLLLLFGAYVGMGWLLSNPAMVKIIPGSTGVVLNTSFCFDACGLWLVLASSGGFRAHQKSPHMLRGLSLFLLLLPGAVFFEILSGINLGIDATRLHALILDRNPSPGRMALNTCLGFFGASLAVAVNEWQQSRGKKHALYALGLFIFLIGISSIITEAMELGWLYSFLSLNRMAVPTAIGMSALGISIFMLGTSASLELPQEVKRQDIRLTRRAGVILLFLAIMSGLAGFTVLQKGTNDFVENELLQKAEIGARSFNESLEHQVALTDNLLSFPVFNADTETLPLTPNDDAARAHLAKVTDILINLGFTDIQLQKSDGTVLFEHGAPLKQPGLAVPLTIDHHDVILLWDNGFMLHMEKPILHDGAIVAKLVTEQRLTEFDHLLAQIRYAAATSDAGICRRAGDSFECFPNRFVPHYIKADMFKAGQPTFPIVHALLGETGYIYASDVRGIPVLAAYTPIAGTGMGFGVKIETSELYKFVRDKLHMLFVVIAILVGIGFYLLRIQLQPLASRLVHSEQRARDANASLEADTERLNQLIAIQQEIALAPFNVALALQIIVDGVQTLTRSAGAIIEQIDGEDLHYRATSGAFACVFPAACRATASTRAASFAAMTPKKISASTAPPPAASTSAR